MILTNGFECRPVIFALPVSAGRMVLKSITLLNAYADENTAQRIELMTGAYETGPWSSVLEFISTQTIEQQSFDANSAGPVLSRFVKILVHDTYGINMCSWRREMCVHGA